MNDIGGLVLSFCVAFCGLLYYTYDNLEYKGYPRNSSCTGQCYADYVAEHGTVVEQLLAKQEAAAEDPFSSIRGLWAGCAACHGNEGQGMAVFPALVGKDKDYIVDRLNTYKNRGEVGSMSSTMWGQAAMLSDAEIDTIGEFVQAGFPK